MIQANIFEQLQTFFNILKANQYLGLLSIIALVSLLILLLANKFQHKKITKIIFILVYLGIFITLLCFYHKEIISLLDYLMNNIFLFLFFPNLAVYVLVLIIINILIVRSTFSKKDSKFTKNINIIFFLLFQVIFYLIIDNVVKNNIDVYEQLSIYTNQDLLILIELSMQLFLLWVILLLIIKITSHLTIYIASKKHVNNKLVLDVSTNENELKDVKTIPEFVEIQPIIEEDIKEPTEVLAHNIYNDYIDIEPIKKETLKVQAEPILDINPIIEEKPLYHELSDKLDSIKEEKAPVSYQGLCFENIDLIQEENPSYLKVEDDMDVIFTDDNNYLKSIIFDIKQLKNNQNDKNKIKKIYENIKLNQKDLTLKDYNNLINMLLELKK